MTKFNFRHIMKDGRILKPGEKLPITPEGLIIFARIAEFLTKNERGEDK